MAHKKGGGSTKNTPIEVMRNVLELKRLTLSL